MVCAPVLSIIPSLKLGDYLSVQAHKPCSISHLLSMLYIYKCLYQVRKMGTLSWEATVPVLVLNFFSMVNSIGPPVVVSSTSHQRSATSLRRHVPAGSNA